MNVLVKQLVCTAVFLLLFSCCTRKDDPGHAMVYITHSGTKYHVKGCAYLGKDIMELSLAEATQRGYSPCTECHAPPALLKPSGSTEPGKAKEEKPQGETRKVKVRCNAFTQKGTQCKRMTDDPSGRCWQHK